MEKLLNNKRQILAVVLAFVLGVFWVFAIRFVTLEKKEVHYHANFAVFVEGERLTFGNFTFYEEIAACGGNGIDSPKIRAHMHEQVNHVVHVHDNGVTWGHFFANLNFVHGDSVFKTDKETYVEDNDTKIAYILNGEEVDATANRTIGNQDVLLISIGEATDTELKEQYNQIEQDADVYNQNDDPSACSGGEPFTLKERLKATFNLSE
jgi:hypothetical protein